MKKLLTILLLILVVGVTGSTILYWDGEPPVIELPEARSVGPESTFDLAISDTGRGLRQVRVYLVQGADERELYQESFTRGWCPWERSQASVDLRLDQWGRLDLPEGPLALRLEATDQGNLWFWRNHQETTINLEYDSRPPRVDVLTTQHYLRQGGTESVLYRVSEEVESGVAVGERRFRGYPLPGHPEGTHIALFALGHDQDPDAPVQVCARDRAGNEALNNPARQKLQAR